MRISLRRIPGGSAPVARAPLPVRRIGVTLAACLLLSPGAGSVRASGTPKLGAAAAPNHATVPPQPPVLEPRVQALSDGYREIFSTLAGGDRSGAIDRAAQFEAQALAANPARAIEWLSQADRVLLDSYLALRPDCALPLAIFYQRLLLIHARDRRFGLTQRALRVAEGLYAQMSLTARSEDERRLTATAYDGFAADLLTVPAPSRAAEMLTRGLLLVPDDVEANIALSVLLLRDRRPAAAAVRLDRVIGSHPDNREAQLRRALMRPGNAADGRAARELEILAVAREADWIALIAAQERARRFIAAGHYDKAISWLDRVIPRFPADSSLRVALAFAAARSSQRTTSAAAAEAAIATDAPAEDSPRRRFSEYPVDMLQPKAAIAEAAADARTKGLAAAIARREGRSR
ncbi:MAG: hypothetical protein ABI639_09655 [Thermoanaerobaculia bacterium]